MGFKQALFLGGAVLVLAACSDVTSPSPLMSRGGASAAAKADTTKTTTKLPGVRTMDETCRSGYMVSSGRDSVCVDEIQ